LHLLSGRAELGGLSQMLMPKDSRTVCQGRYAKAKASHRWPWAGWGDGSTNAWRPAALKNQKPATSLDGPSAKAPETLPSEEAESKEVEAQINQEQQVAKEDKAASEKESKEPSTSETSSPSCPAQHSILRVTAELTGSCCSCSAEIPQGTVMYGCSLCDYDVCEACAQTAPAQPKLSPEVSSRRPSTVGEEVGQHLLSLLKHEANETDSNEAWWCWPGNPWSCEDSNVQDTISDVKLHLPQLEGDETFLGPDGDLYDVFYPSAGADEKEEVSTACSESHTDIIGEAGDVVDKECRPYPVFSCRESSAEAGIADVVEFMRSAAIARYPARARFFELVQEAAASALGLHFERLALVGSTALKIDTPDSDLDVVAFTRAAPIEPDSESAASQELSYPPSPVESLRRIAQTLAARDADLKLQLVDCSRVPVLTVVSADEELSLDLTVDQPLGEWHVLWFQKIWQSEPSAMPAPLHCVPEPVDQDGDSWELGLEAAALRCVKWWLRRRQIPVSKEGGYPTFVWTLMALHVLRCSLLLKSTDTKEEKLQSLIGAIAAFFDRFCECRCSGTLLFSTGPDGMRSEFHPLVSQDRNGDWHPASYYGELSVLDPTTTSEDSAAWGVMPTELATPLSHATRLLHAYELQRAQQLSAAALAASCQGPLPCGEVTSPSAASGGKAVQELFSEVGEALNTLPSTVPSQQTGAFFLQDGYLQMGLLKKIAPKPGWCAPFLHRRDANSAIALELYNVDGTTGVLTRKYNLMNEQWFHACDFVCMASVQNVESGHGSRIYRRGGRRQESHLKLDEEALARWQGMRKLLNVRTSRHSGANGVRQKQYRRSGWDYKARD